MYLISKLLPTWKVYQYRQIQKIQYLQTKNKYYTCTNTINYRAKNKHNTYADCSTGAWAKGGSRLGVGCIPIIAGPSTK